MMVEPLNRFMRAGNPKDLLDSQDTTIYYVAERFGGNHLIAIISTNIVI